MSERQWIARSPHPKTIIFECGNPNCPWKNLDAYPCDDNDNRMGTLRTCPRCNWSGSFDMTTDKKAEMKAKRELFVRLMSQIETECHEFCLYL